MGLMSAIHIARTGIAASQTGLEVTGHNLANAATEGHSRQRVQLTPSTGRDIGQGNILGTGVKLNEIVRYVDEALNTRLRSAVSGQMAQEAREEILLQIESIHAELTDQSLSKQLTAFFDSWSNVANSPNDNSLKSLAVSSGASLADFIGDIKKDLVDVRSQVDQSLKSATVAANSILERIAQVNGEIVTQEAGMGGAHNLRDERDRLIDELSTYFDIYTNEQPSGTVDVFVQSIPMVLGDQNRGLMLDVRTEEGELMVDLRIKTDGTILEPNAGKMGMLLQIRETDVQVAIDQLDQFTHQLIGQINRVHSSGQGSTHYQSLTSVDFVLDTAAVLNSDDAGLSFDVTNGSFEFSVTQKSTGVRQSEVIEVDLDGVGADDTLATLAAKLDAIDNVSATIGVDGRLTIETDTDDFDFSFAEDTSGVLASLGINSFFTGSHAGDMGVNDRLLKVPSLLSTEQGHVTGDNRTALAISKLIDQKEDALGGLSLKDVWNRHVEDYAIRTNQVKNQVKSATAIAEGLSAQKKSVSGVSMDEEAVNLMIYEKAFQGSARLIGVVDQLMDTLMGIIR